MHACLWLFTVCIRKYDLMTIFISQYIKVQNINLFRADGSI